MSEAVMESKTFQLTDGTEVCIVPTETILIRQGESSVVLDADQLMAIVLQWKSARQENASE